MTYKKIAQIAHVSISTVSKALSGSKEISEDLRRVIIEIAEKEGYFAAKSKRKIEYGLANSVTVAIVCPEIISLAYACEITAIKTELEKRGAVVAVYVYDFELEKLQYIIEQIIVGGRADGIILFPIRNFFPTCSIPIVGICNEPVNYDTVSCDLEASYTEIIEYLKKLGHREIAFVGEELTVTKQNTFISCMKKANLFCSENNIYVFKARFEDIGYLAAEEMFKQNTLPTAVICAYDEIALGFIRRLKEKGLSVPDDMSVVGMNNIPMAAYASTPLTTVHFFEKEQAKIAVELLYNKIFEKTETVQHVTVQHKLIVRASTGLKKRR